MKVEKGMKFRGNVNGVEFLITDVNNKIVAYKVLLNGSATSKKRIFSGVKHLTI